MLPKHAPLDLLQKYWKSYVVNTNYEVNNANLNALLQQYNEPHRHYHNLNHIFDLLNLFECYKNFIQKKELVVYAILFHDYIYLPRQKNNEEQSYLAAAQVLQTYAVPPTTLGVLQQYILATQKHQTAFSTDTDLQWFLDFDLAILASTPNRYQLYAQQIRQEYEHVPTWQYKIGRRRVLKDFLKRQQLFYCLPHEYNERAKKNIAWELSKMNFFHLF